ncbi:MAG: ABC transporter permease [Lactobacillales bacterium]|jgi:ABC-2 type transport system permease protein|nr:ABC transporter permease [Lactobacillales bacterium]
MTTTTLKNHIGLRATIKQCLVFAYRGFLKIKSVPEQLVDITLQPILFMFMFTFIFGGAVSGNFVAYLPIVIPGILAQTVIMASISTGVQLREDMDKGVFARFKTLPIARIAPLVGSMITDFFRYSIATSVTIFAGMAIGYRPAGGLGGTLLAGLLMVFVACCMSWIFVWVACVVRTAGTVSAFSMMILFPVTFLSNAFVKVETLPWALKIFATWNPVSHLITAMRSLLDHATINGDFWYTIVGALIILAIFAPLALFAYQKRS